MASIQVNTASKGEADQCIAVIVLGFSNDPGVRWMYPGSQQYLEYFPHFVRAFGGKAFEHGTAWYTDQFLAASLWLPPGVQPDEDEMVTLIEKSVPENDRASVFSLFEQMDSYHPDEPHWHLPLIGADPSYQGKGHGSALLSHTLAVCDEQQTPAYLEATSERTLPLYQRHGFEVLGTIQVDNSPPIIPMLRKPQ